MDPNVGMRMIRPSNGISLITLIITIIVIIILSAIAVLSGIDALSDADSARNQNEIHALEEAAAIRYTSYIKNNKEITLIGSSPNSRWGTVEDCCDAIYESVDFEDMTQEEINNKKEKIRTTIERDYNEYVKVINASTAKSLGVDPFAEEHIFVLDYYTATAYGPIKNN